MLIGIFVGRWLDRDFQFGPVLHRAAADARRWRSAAGPPGNGCKAHEPSFRRTAAWASSPCRAFRRRRGRRHSVFPLPVVERAPFAAGGGVATTSLLMLGRFAASGRRADLAACEGAVPLLADGARRAHRAARGHARRASGRAMKSPLTSVALFHLGPVADHRRRRRHLGDHGGAGRSARMLVTRRLSLDPVDDAGGLRTDRRYRGQPDPRHDAGRARALSRLHRHAVRVHFRRQLVLA